MAQSFPETAHLNIDLKKFKKNYDKIDWSKKSQEEEDKHIPKVTTDEREDLESVCSR